MMTPSSLQASVHSKKFEPTAEQRAARDATVSLPAGEIVAQNACAGSGKTTTMKYIAEETYAANKWRALYVCYNREMAVAARAKFPPSVDCRTVHSLAYENLGRRYEEKLGTLRARDVMDYFDCSADEARAAVATINQFLCSDSPAISADHVLEACGTGDAGVKRLAERLWTSMCDPSHPVPMTHDGYLKLWVASAPSLGNIDLVLVDESQDLNPVILQLVLDYVKKGGRAVFVGDTHQSLYGFRLSIDAMHAVSSIALHNLTLTESWRFPQHVATAANKVLRELKEVDLRIVGRGNGRPDRETAAHCTIARTNARLIEAAEAALRGNNKIHFAATKESDGFDPFGPYRFRELLDVYALFSGRERPQSAHINRFRDYTELSAFAKGESGDGSDADPELAPLVDFVDRHTVEVPNLLRELTARSVGPLETEHHFSTGHRSKGKEWNEVTLLEDFLPLDRADKMKEWRQQHTAREYVEAVNLLYVAVTRGRCGFEPPANCADFFGRQQVVTPWGHEQNRAAWLGARRPSVRR